LPITSPPSVAALVLSNNQVAYLSLSSPRLGCIASISVVCTNLDQLSFIDLPSVQKVLAVMVILEDRVLSLQRELLDPGQQRKGE
jgi:hypothetical protein